MAPKTLKLLQKFYRPLPLKGGARARSIKTILEIVILLLL